VAPSPSAPSGRAAAASHQDGYFGNFGGSSQRKTQLFHLLAQSFRHALSGSQLATGNGLQHFSEHSISVLSQSEEQTACAGKIGIKSDEANSKATSITRFMVLRLR
jgi:hypothetical protein